MSEDEDFRLVKPVKRTLSAKDKYMREIPEHVLELFWRRKLDQEEDKRG